MKKIHLFTLLFAACAQLSCAAGFDCNKANTATEKLICSDESLSRLDEQLSNSYKQALQDAMLKDALKKEQIAWLKDRNTCVDATCLTKSYQSRIGTMNSYVQQYQQRMDMEKEIKALAYKPNYKRINIQKAFPSDYSINKVRPANFFQIAASADDKLCGDVLNVLNEAGTYQGLDQVYWWVSNPNLVKWTVLDKGDDRGGDFLSVENYVPMRVEEFVADIDGNGVSEYSYRIHGAYGSNHFQEMSIFDIDLKIDESMDDSYLNWNCKYVSKDDCEKSKISIKKKVDRFNNKTEIRILNIMSLPSNAPVKKRWVSMTKDNTFIEDFYRKNKELAMSEYTWWSTLIKVNNNYGIILYPQMVNQFEIMYGTLSKDKPIKHQCIFAPQITKH